MNLASIRLRAGRTLPLFLMPVLLAAHAAAQQTTGPASMDAAPAAVVAAPRALPIADYARWRAIESAALSDDGEWAAWTYAQVRRDDELRVRNIDSGREHIVPRASRAVFSDDGR